MKYFIDPTIDCVFKKILAAVGHEKLLMNFLNAILMPLVLIKQIVVQNPYNEKDYLKDKLSIVDIQAQDENDNTYQIEVQMATPEYLAYRMLHNWGDIYQGQLVEGVGFDQLKPVISIWLLTGNLIKNSSHCHHHFECYDKHHKVLLCGHMSIHVLELAKWRKPDTLQPEDNWLYFFKEGKRFKHLPPELKQLPQMREAMSVLTAFSDQSEDYHRYKTRQQVLRIELSDKSVAERQKKELEENALKLAENELKIKEGTDRAEKEAHRAEKEAHRAEKEAHRADDEQALRLKEKARADAAEVQLKTLLAKAGK
ncbi:MAG: Rpn family recombination-promoting nuclease/putative transposase [Algicola sp.]|nr:Rpn family recombination-promoting nuclease/putative transposase [Algicola sp.]